MPPAPPTSRRNMDNQPVWVVASDGKQSVQFEEENGPKRYTRCQRNRIWIFSTSILVNNAGAITPPMSPDVNNGLPGIELWFDTQADHEVGFI